MGQIPFELAIRELLKSAETAEVLSRLSSDSLWSSVDAILLSYQVATFFNATGYSNIDQKYKVQSKLRLLKNLVSKHTSMVDEDMACITLCLLYVDQGYSLTPDIVKMLNAIHKKYD